MSFLSHLHSSAQRARDSVSLRVQSFGKKVIEVVTASDTESVHAYDLSVRFIGADGLPAMDLNGFSDPFFVANIDNKIEYKSAVVPKTLKPVWNEEWFVKNVPDTATLAVQVFDKDAGNRDDFIGAFTTNIQQGTQKYAIEAPNRTGRGVMWLEIQIVPNRTPGIPQYTFNGPVTFSRHSSAALGRFAGSKDSGLEDKSAFLATVPESSSAMDSTDDAFPAPLSTVRPPMASVERVRRHKYSTWKFHLKGVPVFFGDSHQHWLETYPAAQKIFRGPPVIRTGIRTAHRVLYARSTMNDFRLVLDANDFWRELSPNVEMLDGQLSLSANPHVRPVLQRKWLVKPVLYTYVIDDTDRFRFSETGATFATDFASKHALHSCCAETVRYAGEFHGRPSVKGGWGGLNGRLPPENAEWELWIDNASGTYSPDPQLLSKLKECLEYNFPGLKVRTFNFKDEELVQSKKDMKAYAENKPALLRTPSELQNMRT